jgi:hypothetical protein
MQSLACEPFLVLFTILVLLLAIDAMDATARRDGNNERAMKKRLEKRTIRGNAKRRAGERGGAGERDRR